MAKFSRCEVFQAMSEIGLVPIFYHHDIEVAKNVVQACYEGGAKTIEFTNRGDFAHEVFGELNKWVLKEFPDFILYVFPDNQYNLGKTCTDSIIDGIINDGFAGRAHPVYLFHSPVAASNAGCQD